MADMAAPRPHIGKAIRAEWNAYQACTTQGRCIPYPYPEGHAMDRVRAATHAFVQKQAETADVSVEDDVSLFFGPHHISFAMATTRSKPFMTILRGIVVVLLPGTAMLNLKDASQVRALLKYRRWKDVVFAEALTTDPQASNAVDLTTLMRELNATQASTPLTVLTAGAFSRTRGSAALTARAGFQGASIWALVKEARREMPALRVSLFDVDPALDACQLAACHPPDGQDYVCQRGAWAASSMVQISTEIPRQLSNSEDLEDGELVSIVQSSACGACHLPTSHAMPIVGEVF